MFLAGGVLLTASPLSTTRLPLSVIDLLRSDVSHCGDRLTVAMPLGVGAPLDEAKGLVGG